MARPRGRRGLRCTDDFLRTRCLGTYGRHAAAPLRAAGRTTTAAAVGVSRVPGIGCSSASGGCCEALAVQNWDRESGPPLDLKWSAWRLVSVDPATGAISGLPTAGSKEDGWHGGRLPNRDDPQGALIGGAWSANEAERRDSLFVSAGGPGLECFNATSSKPCAVRAPDLPPPRHNLIFQGTSLRC